jgi:hypothetical protein
MGNKLCCRSVPSESVMANMLKAEEDHNRIKASKYIKEIYKIFKGFYSIKDIPFIEQAQTLKNTNEKVLQKKNELPPFVFNRILANVERELKKPTLVEENAIYSGYWYTVNLGVK